MFQLGQPVFDASDELEAHGYFETARVFRSAIRRLQNPFVEKLQILFIENGLVGGNGHSFRPPEVRRRDKTFRSGSNDCDHSSVDKMNSGQAGSGHPPPPRFPQFSVVQRMPGFVSVCLPS